MRIKKLFLAFSGLAVLMAVGICVVLALAGYLTSPTWRSLDENLPAVWSLYYAAWAGLFLVSIEWGLILLRFGLRALPLAASGRRQLLVIIALSIPLAALLTLGVLLIVAWNGPGGPIESPSQQPPRDFAEWMANLLNAIAGELIRQFLRFAAIFLTISFGSIFAASGIPLAILLFLHLFPRRWRQEPYVLFLRAFRSPSNVAAIGPIARGVPAGVRVVFVAPPPQQANSWDPVTLGLSGFRFMSPLASVPVYLFSDGARWQDDVRDLAEAASAIVIDVSEATQPIKDEIDILRNLEIKPPILVLRRQERSADVSEPDTYIKEAAPDAVLVSYTESRISGVIRRLVLTALVFALTGGTATAVLAIALDAQPKPWMLALIVLGAGGIALRFAFATSVARGYSRRSAGHLRWTLRSACLDRPLSPNRLLMWSEHLRILMLLTIPIGFAAVVWTWSGIEEDVDTLKSSNRIGAIVEAHSRLARFPGTRPEIDRLLAAHWAKAAETASFGPKLAFYLKSLESWETPQVRGQIESLRREPLVQALAMTYRYTPDRWNHINNGGLCYGGSLLFAAGSSDIHETTMWGYQYRPSARFWNTLSGEPASATIMLPEVKEYELGTQTAAASPDGSYIVIPGPTLIRFAKLNGETITDLPGATIEKAAISPDSRLVATGSPDRSGGSIRISDRAGKLISIIQPPREGGVIDVAFQPRGGALLLVQTSALTIWNPLNGRRIASYSVGDGQFIVRANYSVDGRTIVLATGPLVEDDKEPEVIVGRVYRLASQNLSILNPPFEHEGGIALVASNHDASLIAVGGWKCCRDEDASSEFTTLDLWRATDRRLLCSVPPGLNIPVSAIAFSPDSKYITFVDHDSGRLHVWSVAACREVGEPLVGSFGNFLEFTPDGKFILTIEANGANLWRTAYFEDGAGSLPRNPTEALENWLRMTALRMSPGGTVSARYEDHVIK